MASAGDAGARRPCVIGVTGPIGCGKSSVAGWLAERGARVIDADVLARDVTAPGMEALAEVRARFGGEVFAGDGDLDRAALASVVFRDAAALRDLEAIVHPHVHARIQAELEAATRSSQRLVVVEAIKLVESGLASICDEVWIVACRPDRQRERLSERGMARDDADRRIRAQGDDLARTLAQRASANVSRGRVRLIATDGTREETERAVDAALAAALKSAGR